MAAHDAGSRAGNVRQNAVEAAAIPPCVGCGGVGAQHPDTARRGHHALHILAHALEPRLVDVDGRQVDVRNFEDMGCLLYTSPSPRDGLLSRMPSSA